MTDGPPLGDHPADPLHPDSAKAGDSSVRPGPERIESPSDEMTLIGDESDDGLDDDLMQNMSSSPSIDDGGYHLPIFHISCSLTLSSPASPPPPPPPSRHASPTSTEMSSSPYLSSPLHLPLSSQRQEEGYSPQQIPRFGGGGGGSRRRRELPTSSRPDPVDDDSSSSSISPSPKSEPDLAPVLNEFDDLKDSHHVSPDCGPLTDLLLAHNSSFDDIFDTDPDSSSPDLAQTKSRRGDRSDPDHVDTDVAKYHAHHDDDDDDDDDDGDRDADDDHLVFSDDARFTDSGWGGECLREAEDIDFEFVYALHSFTATVDGQANASKGETMVLLDDSNSYWWLVRVVRDSSIGKSLGRTDLGPTLKVSLGYLPAEHIETPTERLARLNKHRNIDVSV